MSEYIEREAAEKVASRYGCTNGVVIGRHSGLADCIAFEIAKLPAAEVVPVNHGRWERVKNPRWPAHSHDKCSVCNWWNTKNALCYDGGHKPGHSLNYCPNCGAKMDLED